LADTSGINKYEKIWPRTPNQMTRRLNELKVTLEELGIMYENNHVEGGSNIVIKLIRSDVNNVSSVQTTENSAGDALPINVIGESNVNKLNSFPLEELAQISSDDIY